MPHLKKQLRLVFLNVVGDIAALIISVVVSYLFRFSFGIIPLQGDKPEWHEYMKALFVIIPVYFIFFRAYGLYYAGRHIRRIEEIFLVVKACTFSVIILMAVTFFYRSFSYSRIYLVFLWFFSIVLISAARYFIIQWEYQRRRQKHDMTRVLLIGANRNARSIIQWAKNNPHYGQEVIAALAHDPALIGKHVEGVLIEGNADSSEDFIRRLKPDAVVLLDFSFSREQIIELVNLCEELMIEFKIGADFYGLMTRNVDVEYISSVPLLGFRSLPLDDLWNRTLKRIFDVMVTALLILLTLPIWILVIILIKMDDGGPVFYAQERVGRDQKVFNVLKFRTMRINAEKETGPVWAKADDKRRTRSGNFLRRWNIDELPQFLNVLKGDMSLVGPRPERPHFVDQFKQNIPRYMSRHKVKSGLTGWAQVNGYRGNTSIQERIKYDLYYMENWSLLFDIEIIIMTVSAFKNAY